MVLIKLIFNTFYCWEGVVVLKELILTVSMLGGCGGLDKNSFLTGFLLWGGCGGLERTDFNSFYCWEGVVVLKELISNCFYCGRVWWS